MNNYIGPLIPKNCNWIFSQIFSENILTILTYILLLVWSAIVAQFYFKKRNTLNLCVTGLAILLVWLGAAGNLSQWMTTGCVVDNISFFNLFFFNYFDVMIIGGVLLGSYIVYENYFASRR